jgi:hypothetical protein
MFRPMMAIIGRRPTPKGNASRLLLVMCYRVRVITLLYLKMFC